MTTAKNPQTLAKNTIILPNDLWSEQLELFLGVHESKLRFFTPELQLIHSLEEHRT
jgi:hypothetical protein